MEIEVIGADYDCVKHKTKVVPDNGFNPIWDESFNLRILNPGEKLVSVIESCSRAQTWPSCDCVCMTRTCSATQTSWEPPPCLPALSCQATGQ